MGESGVGNFVRCSGTFLNSKVFAMFVCVLCLQVYLKLLIFRYVDDFFGIDWYVVHV